MLSGDQLSVFLFQWFSLISLPLLPLLPRRAMRLYMLPLLPLPSALELLCSNIRLGQHAQKLDDVTRHFNPYHIVVDGKSVKNSI